MWPSWCSSASTRRRSRRSIVSTRPHAVRHTSGTIDQPHTPAAHLSHTPQPHTPAAHPRRTIEHAVHLRRLISARCILTCTLAWCCVPVQARAASAAREWLSPRQRHRTPERLSKSPTRCRGAGSRTPPLRWSATRLKYVPRRCLYHAIRLSALWWGERSGGLRSVTCEARVRGWVRRPP